jgi:hypothetical protein
MDLYTEYGVGRAGRNRRKLLIDASSSKTLGVRLGCSGGSQALVGGATLAGKLCEFVDPFE